MHEPSELATPSAAPAARSREAGQHPDDLEKEADWLHRCVFGTGLAPHVAERYVAAHAHLHLATDVDVARIVERQLDAEAIEFFLRRRAPGNALTQKLRTLLYLVEIEADHYRHFVRHEGSFWSSLPWLVLSPLRSVLKLVKGRWLARRHHVTA